MPSRSFLAKAGIPAVFITGVLVTAEVALRLLNKPFAPQAFWRRIDPGGEAFGLTRVPLRFDRESFWRRAAAPAQREPGEFLLLVLGDGEALGLRDGRTAWPDTLAHLLSLNETSRPLRVLNASEPGYSSLQGRRRFERLTGLRPELACFAFGPNDARRVRLSDAAYARRLEGLGPLGNSWLALQTAHFAWGWFASGPLTPRAEPEEFRLSTAAFVERARTARVVPVLVARGPAAYDEALEEVAVRAGVALIAPAEPGRIAEALLERLTEQGLVLSRRLRAAAVDLARAGDAEAELAAGWGPAEPGADGSGGRRFGREATLTLETLAGESGVGLDVTCSEGFVGRVQVAGGVSHDLSGCRGRQWRRFGIGDAVGERITLEFSADSASSHGLLVHAVRLVPSDEPASLANGRACAAELDLAEAEDRRPELGPGFWSREAWSDGRRGRWTAREASLCLGRQGAEGGLVVDVSLQNPDNVTACRIEANGVPVYGFRTRNGRHRYGIDIQRVAGQVVHVRLIVERTFVPVGSAGPSRDDRRLGLFLHSVRLAASEVP